ncbi:hypothetical protein M4I32_06955 [Microbacterium sp. LRZ72]|uniref:hypothetical protein n=1 Tax=Microbacterium sp. LRZ72 TaxID=2942481 RepID=UPI0029A1BA31|nr:hypothetical protein [Microbacterium sp. LRZ72]MDX2376535.1 hypothetical protein [Microbacterium sp. LRZ72]
MQELAKWVVALSTLVGFGLTMGLNPALYGATADMLARNTQVAARMGWMVAGLVTGATVLFALLQTFDPTSLVTAVRGDVDRALLSRGVDIAAGSIFLVAAAVLAAWALRVPVRAVHPRRERTPNARSMTYFPLGLSCAVIGFTTLPIMYMTGRVTAGLSSDIALRLVAYTVFLLALVGPFVALAWLWSRVPTLSGRVTGLYARLMRTDYRWASAAILGAGGLVFIGLGLVAHR